MLFLHQFETPRFDNFLLFNIQLNFIDAPKKNWTLLTTISGVPQLHVNHMKIKVNRVQVRD